MKANIEITNEDNTTEYLNKELTLECDEFGSTDESDVWEELYDDLLNLAMTTVDNIDGDFYDFTEKTVDYHDMKVRFYNEEEECIFVAIIKEV